MSWLITGGCGFIGSALVRHLLKIGIEDIRIIDNLEVGSRSNLSKIMRSALPAGWIWVLGF